MADQSRQSLERLLEVCRLLASRLDIADLLTTVMQLSANVVGAESASLLLLDEATQELYFDVALGLDPELQKIRLKMGEGLAGWVAETGKPLICNDVSKEPRWSPKVDQHSGFVTRSILAAPMTLKGKLIGVVEAINHVQGPFTVEDLATFEGFASQAAVAIENARLFSSLKAEKQNLEAVFSQMREGAVLTDLRGTVLFANEMARRLLSLQAGRPLGEGLEGLLAKPSPEKVLQGPSPLVPLEITREEPKALILAGSALRLEAEEGRIGQGWIWIFRDVTDERRAEGLKRDFLSLISHKLKTPLAAITGYSQLLLEEEAIRRLPEPPLKALGSIQSQGRKLAELVEKLLSFVTLEQMDAGRLQHRAFPLEAAAGDALQSLGAVLRKEGVEAKIEGSATARGDPELVKEVFRNLIDNAVKFNAGRPKRVAVWIRQAEAMAEASVADNGPGIPPEDVEKIFQKFHQVEASFTGQVEGWGLGLPFSQRVLERLGGSLHLESKLGQGTTVTLRLPQG